MLSAVLLEDITTVYARSYVVWKPRQSHPALKENQVRHSSELNPTYSVHVHDQRFDTKLQEDSKKARRVTVMILGGGSADERCVSPATHEARLHVCIFQEDSKLQN